jgi:hypothetical protein
VTTEKLKTNIENYWHFWWKFIVKYLNKTAYVETYVVVKILRGYTVWRLKYENYMTAD